VALKEWIYTKIELYEVSYCLARASHPLIYTRLKFTLAQCIESCQGSDREKNKSPTDQFCHCP